MRTKPNSRILVAVLCLLLPHAARSQENGKSPVSQRGIRRATPVPRKQISKTVLINPNDGMAIISAALESRHRSHPKPDCSHLVHSVYERAGFPYPYASSSDLYQGIEQFHRVKHPQSGDLVVWPGHAGIAVSPSQSSFFGAFTSGIGVESYSSPYWRERGAPRFYRYAWARATRSEKAKPTSASLSHADMDSSTNPISRPVAAKNPQ